MKLFWNYLWQHRMGLVLFFLFGLVFAGVFSLYSLELEAIFYALLWCSLLACVLTGVDFVRFCARHRQLERIAKNSVLLADTLPRPLNQMEEDYQEILADLLRENREILTQWQTQRSDSIDYYTTWVHQIKTPISAMRMMLQAQDTSENRQLLLELFRIEQYVEMVLSYFRLDSSSSDFVFREYPLDPIIRQAIRKYAPQFVGKRIQLIYEPTDQSVLTDEKWLQFILEQLLSNAIKYTPKGTITIRVDAEKTLRITDTGIGIAPEDLPRVFEKGFTGYNGRADKKSTGLGLYLCKQAAQKLSHRIEIDSRVGVGTTVSLGLASVELQTE